MGLDMFLLKTKRGENSEVVEIAYWRKANQIHNWFVKNVQHGRDDCGSYEVTPDRLEDLLATCKEVKESIKLIDGKAIGGQTYTNGQWVNNIVQEKVIENASVAKRLLPTCSGFFFGSTDYDQYYAEDIENTIEMLEKILKETNFNNYTVKYYSSW